MLTVGETTWIAPLHLAETYDQPHMIDFLLSRGAELEPVAGGDDRDGARKSPYWRQYDTRGSERLRRRGIPSEGTPLQMAAHRGHDRVVSRLIERGACFGIDTAIDMAARGKDFCQYRFDNIIALLKNIKKISL